MTFQTKTTPGRKFSHIFQTLGLGLELQFGLDLSVIREKWFLKKSLIWGELVKQNISRNKDFLYRKRKMQAEWTRGNRDACSPSSQGS